MYLNCFNNNNNKVQKKQIVDVILKIINTRLQLPKAIYLRPSHGDGNIDDTVKLAAKNNDHNDRKPERHY